MQRAAAAIAAVAAAALAQPALASLPPTKPQLVDLHRQKIGTLAIGDPAIKFSFGWAPPDRGSPALPPLIPDSFELWRSLSLPWAVVTFSAADQQHATAILYRAPFRTTKGDVRGTTLKTVLTHWHQHGRIERFAPTIAPRPAYLRVKIEDDGYFYFNSRKRLVAVQIGTGSADGLINYRP